MGCKTSLYPTAVFEHFLNDGISVGRSLTLYPVKKELAKGCLGFGIKSVQHDDGKLSFQAFGHGWWMIGQDRE
jgi:hypothetical protein